MNPDLEDTIVALEAGVANIDPNAALQNVQGWRARLEGAEFPHASDVRLGLEELSTRLANGDLKDVGELLARLANFVNATVSYAPADVREDLARLGDLLHRGGTDPI